MNLGTLINTLGGVPQDLWVRYDDGSLPQRFFSWRGSYDELTLHEGWDEWNGNGYDRSPPLTVAQLLEEAKNANGATFEGYKGGDFRMALHTPVWADPCGEYRCRAIVGAAIEGDALILKTQDISEYR